MNKTITNILKIVAIASMMAFVANLLVDNPYSHRLIRTQLNRLLEEHTEISLEFSALKLSVIPPGMTLYAVKVTPRADPSFQWLSASKIRADVSLWAAILGDFRLSLVESSQLTVVWPMPFEFPGFLKEDPLDGPKVSEEKIPHPAAGMEESLLKWPPAFDLPIDRILLANANFSLDLPIEEEIPAPLETLYLTASGVDLDLRYHGWDSLKADLSVNSFDLAMDSNLIVDDTGISTHLESLGTKEITLQNLKAQGPRIDVDGTGSIELKLVGDVVTELITKVKGDIKKGDLSILGSFLELGNTHGLLVGESEVEVTVPLEGPESATTEFKVKGQGQLTDGYIDGFRLFDSATAFEVDSSALTLSHLRLIIGGVEYGQGAGTLSFQNDMPFSFKTKLQGARMWDLLDAVGVSFRVVDMAVQSPELTIEGTASPFVLKAHGKAGTSDIILPETPYDHGRYPVSPHCRLNLNLKVDQEQLVTNGTEGICYQPRALTPEVLGDGDLLAPSGATHISEVKVEGNVHFTTGLDLKIETPKLELGVAQYFSQVPLAGLAKTTTKITGPFETVVIKTDLAGDQVEVMGMPLGKVQGSTEVVDQKITLQDFKSKLTDGGEIHIPKATLLLNPQKTLSLKLSLDQVSSRSSQRILKALVPSVPIQFAAHRVRMTYEAPLFEPFAALGTLDLDLGRVQYGDEILADRVQGYLTVDPKRISSTNLRVEKGSLLAQGKVEIARSLPGTKPGPTQILPTPLKVPFAVPGETMVPKDLDDWGLGLLEGYSVEVQVDEKNPLTPGGLQSLPFMGDALQKAKVNGGLTFSGKISGGVQGGPMGAFGLDILEPKVFGNELPGFKIKGFVKEEKAELTFNHSGQVLEGRFSVDFSKQTLPYQMYMDLDKFDLRFLVGEFFAADPRNYAYLTGEVNLKGSLTNFLNSTGRMRLEDTRINFVRDVGATTKNIMLRQEAPVALLLEKNQWVFEGDKTLFLTGDKMQVRVGMGPNQPPENLNIIVDALADMGLAREFFQGVDTAEGQVKAGIKVTGPLIDPQVRLDVSNAESTPFNAGSWRPVTLGLADLRPAFRNIEFDAYYQDGQLVIQSFRSDKGGGQVAAQGRLALEENQDQLSRLGISFNNATIVYPVAFLKSFETQLTGDLVISGKGLPYSVEGNLKIVRARSTKEVDIREEIINALRQKSFSTVVSSDQPNLNLNIKVTADQSIAVNNRNLQSVLSADLQISGTDLSPVVRGQIDVNKGKFIYKRDFQILRGGISFDDPVKPDPNLDIVAVSDVDSYRVFITISGRASNPSVEFSIDPPTRETGTQISKLEILVLLSRGKLPNESRSIGGETEKAAASEAANLILGQFEEPVEKLFDLSGQKVLRSPYFDTHPSPEGNPVPRINVPLDLGENFDIVVRGDGKNGEIVAEYNVHSNITLNGVVERGQTEDQPASQGPKVDGDAKVNLKFKFSFE